MKLFINETGLPDGKVANLSDKMKKETVQHMRFPFGEHQMSSLWSIALTDA